MNNFHTTFVILTVCGVNAMAQQTSCESNCCSNDCNSLNIQLLQICSHAISKTKVCPTSFTYLPDANKCYKLVTGRYTLEEARDICISLNAHSVIINDGYEQKTIAAFMGANNATILQSCAMVYKGFPNDVLTLVWTAGQRVDPATKSTFVWKPSDSWSEIKYTAWHTGQPSWSYGIEDCLHIGTYPGAFWNDVTCKGEGSGGDKMCVLCEIDMI